MTSKAWPGVIGRTWQESTPWLEPAAAPPADAPNVLMIVLDDVGFGQLGCYGSDIETPNIDALAAGGRRYNNFHTTSMCSPTRASLLTGRNHHAVGMGMIADMCTGFPGYQGEVSPGAATLAEILKPAGYSTFAIGKWHLTRVREMNAAGPFHQWPLGRGFERYYGFLYSLMDHWNPELIADNHAIPSPRRPGYHLTEDLVDQTIGMIRDQQAAQPGKPFFAYLALGACHSPHQAPQAYIDKYRGRYDEGWGIARERWFRRQLELGIIPADTRLPPFDDEVADWEAMTPDERRLCARHQEVFAGFLDHTDAQIGRLIDDLKRRNLLENTLVILLSDNGASSEGRAFGDINLRRYIQSLEEPFEQKLAEIDRLGSEHTWNNYPRGWGHVGNTPLRLYKMYTHGGGIRDPLIIHWPGRIADGGAISPQFCHCNDIAPTILECIGLTPPAVLNGHVQVPMDGTSLAYTFSEPQAPGRKTLQYFELMGHRGLWRDGWKAVARHTPGADYDDDVWELYHLDADFSESRDLAAEHPGRLGEMIALWWEEAQRNQVLPLDDRNLERILLTYFNPPRTRWDFEAGMTRVSGYTAPGVTDRSYDIHADIEIVPGDSGVILAVGGRAGGYVLFLGQDGRLVHEYVGPDRRTVLASQDPVPAGRHQVAFSFRRTARCAGDARLLVDGETVASGVMTDMWPVSPTGGGVCCGYDEASPLSDAYVLPARFTGRLYGVAVEALTPAPRAANPVEIALRED